MEYSCDEDNDTSGLQNEQVEDAKMGEKDDANEKNNTEGGGKDITTGPWTFTPPSVRQKEKKEEKTVHCQLCSEWFSYNSGLRTHMEHVHPKYKANEDDILAEQISRQQKVLSTIPKAEMKKWKNTKKEKCKVTKSKISDKKRPFTRQKYREMQEDELKSKKSDIADTDKKKKYELRNRKQDEDMSDNSMSVTDAMSILDKHKTRNSVEEDVTKKGNDEQDVDIDRKPRRRTRSSIAKQTITEMLDEIFEPDNSDKIDESRKKKKNDEKQAGKVTSLLDSYADGTAENINAEETSGGKQKQKKMAKGSDSKKGKKKEQKSKKSLQVPKDDSEQTYTGNNRHQTCNTTLSTNNSDNASEVDGGRTMTDDNPEEGTNETANDEQNNKQPKLDPSIATRSTRKRKAVSTQEGQDQRNETTNDVQADDETEDYFHCHICKKTFVNYNNFRAHKIKC